MYLLMVSGQSSNLYGSETVHKDLLRRVSCDVHFRISENLYKTFVVHTYFLETSFKSRVVVEHRK